MKEDFNLVDYFNYWEKKTPDSPFLNEPVRGNYQSFSWSVAGNQIRRMASYLRSTGIPDGSHIAVLGKNSAHWIMADLAIMMAGYVSIPLYPNLTPAQLRSILDHSESRLIFIGKLDNFDELKKGIPDQLTGISFPFYPHPGYKTWDQALENMEAAEFPKRENEELCCILYTSGTTGEPKGVMHSFGNFAFALHGIKEAIDLKDETFFSYLPLCHVAEKMVIESASLLCGGKIFFAESLDTFAKDLAFAQPTIFLAVPRIWTKFQESILKKIPQKVLNVLLVIPGINLAIKRMIKKKLGLNRARILFTGAAPISTSLLKWFNKLGLKIQEGYGMTENLSYSHLNRPGNIRIGSVGQALPRCEVKLSEIGEVLIKSEATMMGYYKDKEQTDEVIVDGFLKTGDEGKIDEDGFLFITGRIKDIFKTSKGKYVSPAPIEKLIMDYDLVSQACVVGSGLPQPIVLVTATVDLQIEERNKISEHFSSLLNEINQKLAMHEQVKKVILVQEEWTVGEILTPTLKIKRKSIESVYGPNFEVWFEATENVIIT